MDPPYREGQSHLSGPGFGGSNPTNPDPRRIGSLDLISARLNKAMISPFVNQEVSMKNQTRRRLMDRKIVELLVSGSSIKSVARDLRVGKRRIR